MNLYERGRNIILYKIPQSECKENLDTVMGIVNKADIGISELYISTAYRFGNPKNNKVRPILI